MESPSHIDSKELAEYLLGRLSDLRNSQIDLHLSECEACRDCAAALEPRDRISELLAEAHQESGLVESTSEFRIPAEIASHPRYEWIRPLGKGGMGHVWLAKHLVMERPVAIKILRPDLHRNPEYQQRFQRELLSLSRLKHPNIAAALDAEHVGEITFLVMEWIEGVNLLSMVEDGPLPIGQACSIIQAIARGLDHAHALGFIHRDVKPSNIMIDRTGTPKLLDFGLTSTAGAISEITGQGILMGTPDYIAPEQAEDPRNACIQSDIYSLGCSLHHLLSGHVPFPRLTILGKLDSHRYEMPEVIIGLPLELHQVLSRMIAKSCKDRFETMKEVEEALEPFASSSGNASDCAIRRTLVPKAHLSSRRTLLIGSGCTLGTLGLGWWGISSMLRGKGEGEGEGTESHLKVDEGPKNEYAISLPTSFSQGTKDDIEIDGEVLRIDATNRGQVWLNYLDHVVMDLGLHCELKLSKCAAHYFFKLDIMERNEQGTEFNFQVRRQNGIHRMRIEQAELGTKKIATLWQGPQSVDFENQFVELEIRLIDSELTGWVDGQVVASVPVSHRYHCFACIASYGCVADVKRPMVRVYE